MGFDRFLRDVAPLLGLQWRPFKRRGIKRKVERRIAEFNLPGFEEYLLRVKTDSGEKRYLARILAVTISRFFRDLPVFQSIGNSLLPPLLNQKEREDLRIWSIGCASGEEPYTLRLLWKKWFEGSHPQIRLSIMATDINGDLLRRAEEGRYKESSIREVPEDILRTSFRFDNGTYILGRAIRESVEFGRHDILLEEPFPGMDIVFCRNLAFTYFSKESQIHVLKKIFHSMKEGGHLVIGKDEVLPLTYPALFIGAFPREKIYRKFRS
jgi:chemotaxis protein methyltransferase CheR